MDVYKLTNGRSMTRNNTWWAENKTYHTNGNSDHLCNDQWLHFYLDPIVAVLMAPIYSNWAYPILWTAKAEGKILLHHQLKGGCTKLTTISRTKLPSITIDETRRFVATLLAQSTTAPLWKEWLEEQAKPRPLSDPLPKCPDQSGLPHHYQCHWIPIRHFAIAAEQERLRRFFRKPVSIHEDEFYRKHYANTIEDLYTTSYVDEVQPPDLIDSTKNYFSNP